MAKKIIEKEIVEKKIIEKEVFKQEILNNKNSMNISCLPIELNKYIYNYIPSLHCSQCFKSFIDYDIRHIYHFVKIRNMIFCDYYCAIKFKYYEYIFIVQWQFLIITLKLNLFIGYIVVVCYILMYIFFIAILNIIRMLIFNTF